MNSRRRNNQHYAQFMFHMKHLMLPINTNPRQPMACVLLYQSTALNPLCIQENQNKVSENSKPPYVITNYYCKSCKKIRVMGWGLRAILARCTGPQSSRCFTSKAALHKTLRPNSYEANIIRLEHVNRIWETNTSWQHHRLYCLCNLRKEYVNYLRSEHAA